MVVECLLVGDDVIGFDRGEDSDFIQGVDFLFLFEFLDFYFLQGVNLPIVGSLDFVDCAEGALAEFGKRYKVFELGWGG